MDSYSYGKTPLDVILAALNDQLGPQRFLFITPAGRTLDVLKSAVNQGIDSHLEGIVDSTFEEVPNPPFGPNLKCLFGHKDMLVLLRRLLEISENPDPRAHGEVEDPVCAEAMALRIDILTSLDIDEV